MNKEEWDREVNRVVQEFSASMHDKMYELARTAVEPGIFEAAMGQIGCNLIAASLAGLTVDERETGLECAVNLIRHNLLLLDAQKKGGD